MADSAERTKHEPVRLQNQLKRSAGWLFIGSILVPGTLWLSFDAYREWVNHNRMVAAATQPNHTKASTRTEGLQTPTVIPLEGEVVNDKGHFSIDCPPGCNKSDNGGMTTYVIGTGEASLTFFPPIKYNDSLTLEQVARQTRQTLQPSSPAELIAKTEEFGGRPTISFSYSPEGRPDKVIIARVTVLSSTETFSTSYEVRDTNSSPATTHILDGVRGSLRFR